jgi:hypothetical protein
MKEKKFKEKKPDGLKKMENGLEVMAKIVKENVILMMMADYGISNRVDK